MGGTLMVSRSVNNHSHYEKRGKAFGFTKITTTALDKDGLNSLISEMKPDLLMMGARFYECSTPYMMGELKRNFPDVKMAALSFEAYPPDLAMYFILNGVSSYVSAFEGFDQFYEGLENMSKGKNYISPVVQERIDMRGVRPKAAKALTLRHIEVIRRICCGLKDNEIADLLYICRRTVTTHKTDIFTSLNIRNHRELMRTALNLKIINENELYFYPKDLILNPLPDKARGRKK
jgi:two-component system invasion response regulator UvrY